MKTFQNHFCGGRQDSLHLSWHPDSKECSITTERYDRSYANIKFLVYVANVAVPGLQEEDIELSFNECSDSRKGLAMITFPCGDTCPKDFREYD